MVRAHAQPTKIIDALAEQQLWPSPTEEELENINDEP
jgi:hypothetical protein